MGTLKVAVVAMRRCFGARKAGLRTFEREPVSESIGSRLYQLPMTAKYFHNLVDTRISGKEAVNRCSSGMLGTAEASRTKFPRRVRATMNIIQVNRNLSQRTAEAKALMTCEVRKSTKVTIRAGLGDVENNTKVVLISVIQSEYRETHSRP